jgi:hypothetical protein
MNSLESSRHLKLACGSLAAKLNDGLVFDATDPFAGPDEMLTVGACVSTRNDRQTGSLRLPATSTARTASRCPPSLSRERAVKWGGHHEKRRVSKRHWKVEPASLDESAKLGVGSPVSAPGRGPEVIAALGRVVSAEKLVNAEWAGFMT